MSSESENAKPVSPADEEQRDNRRSRTYLGGKIVLNQEGSVIDCLVRNKSEAGCQVIVESQHAIPETFELKIGTTGERFKCSIAWRRKDKIGLKFE